jgi:hypothetical protein
MKKDPSQVKAMLPHRVEIQLDEKGVGTAFNPLPASPFPASDEIFWISLFVDGYVSLISLYTEG